MFSRLFGYSPKPTNAHLFSFTPFKVLSEKNDPLISVNDLNSNTIIRELENENNYDLAKYYKGIKEDVEKEFTNINSFDAICFHTSTNVLMTLSRVPKDNIKNTSVLCIKYEKS